MVIGYHGCDAAVVAKVLSGGNALAPRENDYEQMPSEETPKEDSRSRGGAAVRRSLAAIFLGQLSVTVVDPRRD